MEIEVFTKGVDGHYCAAYAVGPLQYLALVVDQAVTGDTVELLEPVAVVAEMRTQHLWNIERLVAVRNGIEDGFSRQ